MEIPIGFGQVTHLFSGPGAPTGAAVTYGIENTTLLSALGVAQAAQDAFEISLLTIMTDAITLQGTIAKLGPNDIGPSAEISSGTDGGSGSLPATPQVSYLIGKSTNLGGRVGRGRMFLPGVNEPGVDASGELSGSTITNVQAQATNFHVALDGNDIPMVLLHAEGSLFAPATVTGLAVRSRVATQRRRVRR